MRLRNAPLVHVLTEIQFSPVLGVAERMPGIQVELRQHGFPWLTEGAVHTVTVAPGAAPQVTVRPRWAFGSRDRATAVILSESTLAVHTAAYTTVEPFLELVRVAASTVAGQIEASLVARIGLRYVDRVPLEEDVDISELVVSGLLGFPLAGVTEAAALQGLRTETVGSTPDGILAVRSGLVPPEHILPPDLEAGILTYPSKPGHEQWGLIMDFDHFSAFEGDTFDFDADPIIEHVERLHTATRRAFDLAVTEKAIEHWGPWEEV
jgi:uncharacterized protein (TIGR04255 family)